MDDGKLLSFIEDNPDITIMISGGEKVKIKVFSKSLYENDLVTANSVIEYYSIDDIRTIGFDKILSTLYKQVGGM